MKRVHVAFVFAVLVMSAACSSIPLKTMEEKYVNSDSKFIEVMGMRIHYRDEGKGPAIVLLHGMLASLHTWDGWALKLKENYRVVRIDMPGFGITGPAPKGFVYSEESMVKVLDALFIKLNLNRFTIAGNSLGGYFSWRYTIAHPEKIERLILLDAAGYPQEPPGPIKLATAPVVGYLSTKVTPRFIIDHYVKQVYGDPARLSQATADRYYDMLMREGNRQSSKEILTVLRDASKRKDLGDDIPKINDMKIPVLIMWGAKDTWVPTSLVERWKKDLPNAKFIIYEDASHVPMEEIPERSVADAIKFMQEG